MSFPKFDLGECYWPTWIGNLRTMLLYVWFLTVLCSGLKQSPAAGRFPTGKVVDYAETLYRSGRFKYRMTMPVGTDNRYAVEEAR